MKKQKNLTTTALLIASIMSMAQTKEAHAEQASAYDKRLLFDVSELYTQPNGQIIRDGQSDKANPMMAKFSKNHPYYGYYKKLQGSRTNNFTKANNEAVKGDIYLHYENYRGNIGFYTPIGISDGLGVTNQNATLNAEEQLYFNSTQDKIPDKYHQTYGLLINGNVNFKNRQMPLGRDHTVEGLKNASKSNDLASYYNRGSYSGKQGHYKPTYGEWRMLGYTTYGAASQNPYFPADAFLGREADLENYKLLYRPWDDSVSAALAEHESLIDYEAQKYKDSGLTYVVKPKDTLTTIARMYSHLNLSVDKIVQMNKISDPNLIKVGQQLMLGGTPDPRFKSSYDIKYNAVERLLESNNGVWRKQVANQSGIRGVNDHERKQQVLWMMDHTSLANNPANGDAAYFIGIRQDKQYYVDMFVPASKVQRDMSIVKQEIYVDGIKNPVQTFTREESGAWKTNLSKLNTPVFTGETVTVKSYVKNVSVTGGKTAYKTTLDYSGDSGAKKVGTNQQIDRGKTQVVETRLTIPTGKTKWSVSADMDFFHNLSQDNYEPANDIATNAFDVLDETGNLIAKNVVLVDKKNNEIAGNKAIPGKEYKIRYTYEYDGKNASMNSIWAVQYKIKRMMPGGQNASQSVTAVSTEKAIKPKDGDIITFDTPYHVFETGVFESEASLVSQGTARYNERYNTKTTDDRAAGSWTGDYDYTVSNVKVEPADTTNTSRRTAAMLVTFDVNHKVPNHVNNYGKDVQISVFIDGVATPVNVTEHIRQGTNKNVSVKVDVPLTGANQNVKAAVIVNPNAQVYEVNYANNRADGTGKITNATRVTVPNSSEKAKSWNQYFQVNTWMGPTVTYKHFNNNQTYSFKDYTTPAPQATTKTMMEALTIEKVWFKSKYTTDKKMGPKRDGWVNLMQENGKIKAGYGYELQIEVAYKTDAFKAGNLLDNYLMTGSKTNGKWARPGLVEALIPENIYVQTPDKKIHSVDGDGGTTKSMQLKSQSGSIRNNKNWVYSVQNGTALGETTIGKFYIEDDISNGIYNLNVFTPKVSGLAGKMTNETTSVNHKLHDLAKDLKIEVVGSATDDVTDHIND